MQEYLNNYDTLTYERKHEIYKSIIKIHRKIKDRSDNEKLFAEKYLKE